MTDDTTEKIVERVLAAVRADREANYADIKNAIRTFFNLGLVVLLVWAFVGMGALEMINESPSEFTAGESLLIILVIGVGLLMSVLAWDIISGINIIEQKVKILCDKKE